jgi:hypothetical protein
MDGAVAYLKEVNAAGEDARFLPFRRKLNAVLNLKRVDVRRR